MLRLSGVLLAASLDSGVSILGAALLGGPPQYLQSSLGPSLAALQSVSVKFGKRRFFDFQSYVRFSVIGGLQGLEFALKEAWQAGILSSEFEQDRSTGSDFPRLP